MQQLSLALFFVFSIFFSDQCFAIKTKEIFAGYRVIRASPQNFLSALKLQDAQLKKSENESDRSRLSRYFKIKNKIVRQDSISFQIYPDFPILKDYYEANQHIEFIISETGHIENNIDLKISMFSNKKEVLSGRIEITRHELGSLLKFYIIDSTYNPMMLDLFIKSFKLAHITFSEEKEATKQTLKESP